MGARGAYPFARCLPLRTLVWWGGGARVRPGFVTTGCKRRVDTLSSEAPVDYRGGGRDLFEEQTRWLALSEKQEFPVAETQAGQVAGVRHRQSVERMGVTGTSAANSWRVRATDHRNREATNRFPHGVSNSVPNPEVRFITLTWLNSTRKTRGAGLMGMRGDTGRTGFGLASHSVVPTTPGNYAFALGVGCGK